MNESTHDVTRLLQAWGRGDTAALDKLVPLVYDELHRLAHCYMAREWANDTLQTTALVHEAYLRLVNANEIEWKNRVHFFAISANVMRRILVEFARSRGSQKRGGDVRKVSLEEAAILPPSRTKTCSPSTARSLLSPHSIPGRRKWLSCAFSAGSPSKRRRRRWESPRTLS